jgi:hypothetical protein
MPIGIPVTSHTFRCLDEPINENTKIVFPRLPRELRFDKFVFQRGFDAQIKFGRDPEQTFHSMDLSSWYRMLHHIGVVSLAGQPYGSSRQHRRKARA